MLVGAGPPLFSRDCGPLESHRVHRDTSSSPGDGTDVQELRQFFDVPPIVDGNEKIGKNARSPDVLVSYTAAMNSVIPVLEELKYTSRTPCPLILSKAPVAQLD
ncbi:MAG: hypothetical protein KDB01_17130, partial [Planctomycetaceae bacterium]|nr:hypothetical protein [Planctomycetaceae bacterium]